MQDKFRFDIEDEFIVEQSCAICSAPALRIHHLPDYADYVSCTACGSSFVAEEGGERVYYGKISELYADTEKVVLKRWMMLDIVAMLASAERQRKQIAVPDFPQAAAQPAGDGLREEQADLAIEAPKESPAEVLEEEETPVGRQVVAISGSEEKVEEPPPLTEDMDVVSAPLPGERYRVKIIGEGVYFPLSECAHCQQTPADSSVSITGSLPVGDSPDRRRRAVFRLPLCAECRQKSTALSEAQKNVRLQAQLTALVLGLAALVVALGLGVVDFSNSLPLGLAILAGIVGVGFLLPLGLLLPRIRTASPLRETYMIRTTLNVRAPEEPAAQSWFDFRNEGYAKLFWESNQRGVAGSKVEVIIQQEGSSPDS
jgi:ribosomal protein S27E